jgi:hypothetical protein
VLPFILKEVVKFQIGSSFSRSGIRKKRARQWIRHTHHFDSMNEKSQITQERLYSEERKGGRTSGITKKMAGQQKKHRETEAAEKSSKQFQA